MKSKTRKVLIIILLVLAFVLSLYRWYLEYFSRTNALWKDVFAVIWLGAIGYLIFRAIKQ